MAGGRAVIVGSDPGERPSLAREGVEHERDRQRGAGDHGGRLALEARQTQLAGASARQ